MDYININHTCPLCGEEGIFELPVDMLLECKPTTLINFNCRNCHKNFAVFAYVLFGNGIPYNEQTQGRTNIVPWDFIERYADWFCASVPYPEFVREAKQFYLDSINAMKANEILQE